MWRVMMAMGLVLGVTVMSVETTLACSCEMLTPREHLEQADAAFVGTLISREPETVLPDGTIYLGEEVAWTFQVEQAIKGDLGETVDVQSAIDSAACGFGEAEGQRLGVMLYERMGEWHSGSCSTVDPNALLQAAQPLPAPDGSGPVALLLGNRGEDPRVIALDQQGRTLAYGAGDGEVRSISVCPGSERFVELVAYPDTPGRKLAVRDMRSLEVVTEMALPDATMNVMALYCRNQSASDIFIHNVTHLPDAMVSEIIRLQDGELETLFTAEMGPEGGNQTAFDFDKGVVYVTVGHRGNDIVEVDLATGEELSVVTVPAIEGDPDYIISLMLSPDGTHLAALGYQPGSTAHFRILMLDVTTDPFEIRELSLGASPLFSSVFWLDDETFVVSTEDHLPDGAPVYDVSLNQVSSIPGWQVNYPVLVADTLYGLTLYGSLLSAPLPDGPTETLRTFDNPNVFVLVEVPGEVEIDQPEPTPSPTATEPAEPVPTATVVIDEDPSPAVPDYDFGTDRPTRPGESSSDPDDFRWWISFGFLAIVVAAGGWGVYRWQGR